jgi:hypothetical protein
VQEETDRLDRIRRHTADEVNGRIDAGIAQRVRAARGEGPDAIGRRIADLEREWDVERLLMLNAAVLALAGVVLAALLSPWFLLLPGIVLAFLIQHATQGWCPPLVVFRRLGKRTRREIDREKWQLRALRGDLDRVVRDGEPLSA